jgi:hypothetical protein
MAVALGSVRNDLIFRNKASENTTVQFKQAAKFKVSRNGPGKYSVDYSHSK